MSCDIRQSQRLDGYFAHGEKDGYPMPHPARSTAAVQDINNHEPAAADVWQIPVCSGDKAVVNWKLYITEQA